MISMRSGLRRKLLTYFLASPGARVYVRELARELGVDSTNLSRELARQEREGFLRSEIVGKERYYSVNPAYPYRAAVFKMLRGTLGVVPSLRERLHQVPGIRGAYLYGSFAKDAADAASDIDLLVVGDPDAAQLAARVSELEKMLRREISYTVLKPAELKRKLAGRDPFFSDIWDGKKIELIGDGKDPAAAHRPETG